MSIFGGSNFSRAFGLDLGKPEVLECVRSGDLGLEAGLMDSFCW